MVSHPSQTATHGAKQAQPQQAPFRKLYDTYFAFVWRCLRGLGVPPAQLDDAAQEVFLVVHRRLPDFRADSSERTWIYGILRGVAANQRRTQRRKWNHSELLNTEWDHGPDPEQHMQDAQRVAFVESFARGLDDRKRDTFVLAVLEQLTIPEVAEILGVPVNTAYTRLRSVRMEFKQALCRKRDAL